MEIGSFWNVTFFQSRETTRAAYSVISLQPLDNFFCVIGSFSIFLELLYTWGLDFCFEWARIEIACRKGMKVYHDIWCIHTSVYYVHAIHNCTTKLSRGRQTIEKQKTWHNKRMAEEVVVWGSEGRCVSDSKSWFKKN